MFWRIECAGTIEGVATYLRAFRPPMDEDDANCDGVRAVLLAQLATLSTNGATIEVEWMRDTLSMTVKGIELTLLTAPKADPKTLPTLPASLKDPVRPDPKVADLEHDALAYAKTAVR